MVGKGIVPKKPNHLECQEERRVLGPPKLPNAR